METDTSASEDEPERAHTKVAINEMALIVDREDLDVLNGEWQTDEKRTFYGEDQQFFDQTDFGAEGILVISLSVSDDSSGFELTDVVRPDDRTIHSYSYVNDVLWEDDGAFRVFLVHVDLERGSIPDQAQHTHVGRDEYTLSTPMGSDSGTSSDRRTVSISDTGSIPSDADLSITASLPRKQITSEMPARLTVEVTNTGSDRAIDLVDSHYCHLFNRSRGGSEPAGIWLYPEQDPPDDRADDRWTRDPDFGTTRAFVSAECPPYPFEAGKSITTTYEVWDDYVADGYLPPSTYRFEASIGLWDSVDDDSDPCLVDWWLELEMTAPESESH
jgi:hypothetical protein